MLTIRLTRIGKKKQPLYRIIISEKARDPWGRALEILGTYNPRLKPPAITLERERIAYWLSKGAQCSDTIWNLFVDQELVKGVKRHQIKLSVIRKAKLAKEKAAAKPAAPAETPSA